MTLHYCSVDEVKTLAQAAPRFASTFETVRDAVTANFNAFMRRNLEYSDNVTQFADTITRGRGQPYYVYTGKPNIDKDKPLIIRMHRDRLWDERSIVGNAEVDYEKGKITLYGPMSFGTDTIRITYSGGFKATDNDPEVMECPPEIKAAAIKQCQYELAEMFNNDSGNKESSRGRGNVAKEKTIDGLIVPVARVLERYRKPLMRVI